MTGTTPITVAIALGSVVLAAPRVGERDNSEARAIGMIRAVTSAETAYAAFHGERYTILDCLAHRACSGLGDGALFLERGWATTREQDGFHFEFFAGPGAATDTPSAITSFAIVAVPRDAGRRTRRAFCADDRAVVYESPPGITPRVARGRCVDTSKPFDKAEQ